MIENPDRRTVLVLTGRPKDYQAELHRLGLAPLFAPSVPRLLDLLLDNPTSGFVLEVDKVMRSHSVERDHLFKVAGAFPLLRVHRKPGNAGLTYLDDRHCFSANAQAFAPRKMRCQARVPTRLNVLITLADAHGVERELRANLLDISVSGGFVYSLEDFAAQDFVSLRILELSDPAPIRAHIRWRKKWGIAHTLPGLGLLFVDIRPGQIDELVARYISPPEEPAAL